MWRVVAFLLAAGAAVWSAGGVVAAGLVAAVGAYLVARRTTSGSITTSDALTLWKAAEQIRQELRDEVVARREEARTLREENARLLIRIADLEAEVDDLKGQVRD